MGLVVAYSLIDPTYPTNFYSSLYIIKIEILVVSCIWMDNYIYFKYILLSPNNTFNKYVDMKCKHYKKLVLLQSKIIISLAHFACKTG